MVLGSDYPFPLGEHHPGKLVESMDKFSQAEKVHTVHRHLDRQTRNDTDMCTCAHAYSHTRMHIHTQACTLAHTQTHTHAHTHMHTHTCTYVHTHTHTYSVFLRHLFTHMHACVVVLNRRFVLVA